MTEAPSKRRTDGDATRQHILEAAGELFAADGYAQTTAKSVAQRAGASVTLINYYFGGRDGLYQAALIEAHRRVINLADLQRLAESELPAPAKLGVLIDGLVRHAARRRLVWHLQVLTREFLAPSGQIHALLNSELPPKLAIIKQILSDIAGIPVNDPALVRCLISVMGPCLLLLVAARGIPGPLDEIRRMPQEAVAAHLHGFALAGLQAIGQTHGRHPPAAG